MPPDSCKSSGAPEILSTSRDAIQIQHTKSLLLYLVRRVMVCLRLYDGDAYIVDECMSGGIDVKQVLDVHKIVSSHPNKG